MPAATLNKEPFWELHPKPVLVAVLLLALGIRIAALADLSRSIYVDFLLWDERIYHEIAIRIANGTYESKSVYEFAPLFAYLMAGIYRLLSADVYYIRLMNILFGVLTCWAVYGIGEKLGGKKIGLMACLGAALYKPLIFYSIVPLKEMPSAFLFALTALASLNAIEGRKLIPAALSGIAAGLLINLRPNAVILLPFLLLIIVWYHYRDGLSLRSSAASLGICLLGFWLAVSPFVIRNYLVAGKFAMTTSQSGFNLYLGNNLANPDPYYRPVPFASPSPFEQGIQFTIEASRRSGKVLTSQEASDFWTQEIFREARARSAAFAWKVIQKTLVLVNRFEACDHYDINFISDFVGFFKLPFLSFWFIFPLAIVALAFHLFRNRKVRVLGLILASYGATLVLFFTNARYRLPMLTLLIPLAAVGIADVMETLRQRHFRVAALWGTAALAAVAVAFLPVRATDDLTAYYNTHAIILDSRGFENEAILYWQQSSQMNRPFSAFANLSLAQKYFQRGRILEGNGFLSRISDDSFAAAAKYELTGDNLVRQKKIGEAVQAYERSLAINSGQRRTLYKLVQIHRQTDPAKADQDEAQLKYVSSFFEAMQQSKMELPL